MRFLTKTNTTSLTNANALILINKYYEQVTGKLLTETAAAKWKFGDFNYSAFPSFTVTMTNSTAEYDLNDWGTTDEEAILNVLGAEVLDNNGIWRPLKRVTLREIHQQGVGQTEYFKTDGIPIEYELRDNFIVLYPAPDNGVSVTLSGGLKIFSLRTADKFTSAEVTTGTKEPGFPSPYHDLLAYGPAYDVAVTLGLPNAANFKLEYNNRMDELLKFIGKRDQAEAPVMTMKKIRYI